MDDLIVQIEPYVQWIVLAVIVLGFTWFRWRRGRVTVRITHDHLVAGDKTIPWREILSMNVTESGGTLRYRLEPQPESFVAFRSDQVEGNPIPHRLTDVLAARAGLVRSRQEPDGSWTWKPLFQNREDAYAEPGPGLVPANAGSATADFPAKSAGRSRWALFAALAAILFKFKWLFAFLKFGKILTTTATMALSIVLYSFFYGWAFAAGFVLLILVHELGHAVVLKAMGIPITAPVFIPFLGAFIGMKEQPKDAKTEAITAYGGPLVGGLASLACLGVGRATEAPIWYALAASGFLLNLFNLIPVSPMDGGRIAAAISPKLWWFGVPLMAALFFLTWNPILLIAVVLGGIRAWQVHRTGTPELAAYYDVPINTRLAITLAYCALAGALAYMVTHAQELHGPIQPV